MGNSFSSLAQIKLEYEIEEEEFGKIRTKLRSMQSSIHPDRNRGTVFLNEEDEARFHRLSEAIEFLDRNEEAGPLVPASAVTDLTRAVTELVKSQKPNFDDSLSEQIRNNIESYRSRFKLPKIALSAISIALTAVWFFPETLAEHPVLGKWISLNDTFAMLWLLALLFTALFWFISWIKEDRHKRYQENLKAELVQNNIFRTFIKNSKSKTFTLEDIVQFIMKLNDGRIHNSKLIFFYLAPFIVNSLKAREIDISLAHTVAEIIIRRALSRQAIKKTRVGNISETYTLVDVNIRD